MWVLPGLIVWNAQIINKKYYGKDKTKKEEILTLKILHCQQNISCVHYNVYLLNKNIISLTKE